MRNCFCIMGLSNVGKSSLFNYLIGQKLSIVMDMEDTTVDYLTYNFENFTLIDTCGLHSSNDIINEFSGTYFNNTDIVLYVVDARKNDYNKDREILNFLIRSKKIWLIANFVTDSIEHINLPYDRIFTIGMNFENADILKNALHLSTIPENRKKIVIIGACNVGKSTLFNSLVQLKRSRVSPIAGTTRDNVVQEFKDFDLIDTAGYKSIEEAIDSKAANMRNEVISQSYGLIVVIDGSNKLTRLDKELISFIDKHGTFGIIVVNKYDIFNEEMKYFIDAIQKRYSIVYTSALHDKVRALEHQINNISKSLQKFTQNLQKNMSIINDHVKKMQVSDIKNGVFSLKGIKLTNTNQLTFVYDSYWPVKEHNIRTIKNFIITQFKLFGCHIEVLHKRSIES